MDRLSELMKTTPSAQWYSDDPMEIQRRYAARCNSVPGNLNEQDGIDCPICMNRGLIYRAEEGTGNLLSRECVCKKKRREAAQRANSNAPADTSVKTFDTYRTQEPWQAGIKQSAIAFTDGYAKGAESWFFLGGQPGSGKTHIAKAIYNVMLQTGAQVVYMSWKEDAGYLKALLNTDGYKPMTDRYKRAEVLFIDDFLKTRREADGTYRMPTDGDMNLAFEIIKHRDENNLVTVITSEFTVDGICSFDQSTGGRIRQRSGAYCLAIRPDAAKDYRRAL